VYELWRQDDNGNRYKMKTFGERLPALAEALVFTARGHRQLYQVVGPPGAAVRTNADLYELCCSIPDVAGDRDLQTFLLALYRISGAVDGQDRIAAETFGALLLAAATAEPAAVDPAWRLADLSIPADGPFGHRHWQRVLLSQAADLADFAEDPPDGATAYFGMPCRHPAGAGPRSCAGYWYNQDLASYLECAARIQPPEAAVGTLGWGDLIDFAWAGQSYE
jgi:hypothetical protein